ncbi:hypothetical protein AABB24_019954 [Solanum stoloniferum]|uniref:Small hydrophobic protein n=2 Tax=Solanum TaxID=4107 RepID=A0AAF1A1Y2_SOLVR|nr:uncharacterized protein LOC125819927 [Solanum verrucosum]WMV57094.1 hypothetical protein MTR67_050479 [Solanum verrucosum]
MAISDKVTANLTTLYLAIIGAMKAYGLITGRNFTGCFVLILSTAAVALVLILTLTWDIYIKARNVRVRHNRPDRINYQNQQQQHTSHEFCRGGICWHGVAVSSPASHFRFRLPQNRI